MDQIRPKTGNPFPPPPKFLPYVVKISFCCCSGSHILFEIKTFKIPTKVDSDETDAFMGLNDNDQETGRRKKLM